jgi:hypothetical protein
MIDADKQAEGLSEDGEVSLFKDMVLARMLIQFTLTIDLKTEN